MRTSLSGSSSAAWTSGSMAFSAGSPKALTTAARTSTRGCDANLRSRGRAFAMIAGRSDGPLEECFDDLGSQLGVLVGDAEQRLDGDQEVAVLERR